jgi:diguanylate cyclase (GGDEF)-like protein
MRVLLRILFVLFLSVALVALIISREELSRWSAPFTVDIGILIVAAILGIVLAVSQRRTDAPEPAGATSQPLDTPAAFADGIEERALLAFAKSLIRATSTEDLRATVQSELPVLLNGRTVWLAWDKPGRVATAPQAPTRTSPPSLLTPDVQEWTTFVLRLEKQRLGLLGVESAGGLSAVLKERIQTITPLIAQGLKSTQDVEVFREASVVDLLTGASTRREGLQRLQAEAKRAQRTNATMAVLMIDLDHFKSVNDRHGHAVGDTLLTAIGETLARTLRATDVRCRWGGEEFLVVLPDTSLAQAQVVATHLLQNLAGTTVPTDKGLVSSTASIGLTVSRPSETDVGRIVNRADMALYQAKNAGRGCVRVVLAGFDGEPMGFDSQRKPASSPMNETLPFPDRRNPDRPDRRRVPSPGRRRTDPQQAPEDALGANDASSASAPRRAAGR